MAKVAFLGLGVMGFPMAGHLVKKGGHEVTVYNRTAAKAKEWADKFGGKTAATPKAAAEGQDFVMCCVGNDNDVREVALGMGYDTRIGFEDTLKGPDGTWLATGNEELVRYALELSDNLKL